MLLLVLLVRVLLLLLLLLLPLLPLVLVVLLVLLVLVLVLLVPLALLMLLVLLARACNVFVQCICHQDSAAHKVGPAVCLCVPVDGLIANVEHRHFEGNIERPGRSFCEIDILLSELPASSSLA